MYLVKLGDKVPRRGNAFSRWLGRFTLRLFGWRMEGEFPNLNKCVFVAAPHTSNWDFLHGIAVVFALGLRVSWMGKDALFKRPFGWIMRWLGGVAIDRSASHGVVAQMAQEFANRSHFLLAVTPEGTRSRVARWKTGFYHIARSARVPIVLVYLDYRRRVLGVGDVVVPTGAVEQELDAIRAFFQSFRGKAQPQG